MLHFFDDGLQGKPLAAFQIELGARNEQKTGLD